MNKNYQMIISEQDIVTNWLSGNTTPNSVVVDDDNFINIYNDWCHKYDIEDVIQSKKQNTSDKYIEQCTDLSNWNMPTEYKEMNIQEYLISKCATQQEQDRVILEMNEYSSRGMIPVLKFLKYLVDTCSENNVVLGVGRGSSVASYCLFLLGVHRINSIKYELDIKEFLK